MAAILMSAAMFTTIAKAADDPTQGGNFDDLILGFETGFNTADAGSGTNVLVDLGQASNFTSLEGTGQQLNLSSFLSLSDLSGYGSTPSDLFFGVTGTDGNSELFVSSAGNPLPRSSSNQTTPVNLVSGIYGVYYDGTPGATGSTDSLVASSQQGSFTQIAGTAGTYGNVFSNTLAQYSANGTETLSLYDVPQSTASSAPATKIGTLALTVNNGTDTLEFTATASPEPPTYLMMGAGVAALVYLVRRRAALNL